MNRQRILNRYKNSLTLGLYYGVRLLTLLAVAFYFSSGDLASAVYAALIFLLILAPAALRERGAFIPFTLDLAIGAFVFLTVLLGSVSNFYERFEYWDVALHFQSGFLLGIFGFSLVYMLNEQKPERLALSPAFVSFFAVCFSSMVSVVWEIYEYAGDSWFGSEMQESGLPDTMGDLILNLVGAIIVAAMGYVWMRRRKRVPFTPTRICDPAEARA